MTLPDDLRAAAGGVDRRCKVPRRRRTTLGPVSVEMLLQAADEIDRLQARTAALEGHLRWVAEWADRHAYQAMARRIEQVLADH